jgi:hypothetical protein
LPKAGWAKISKPLTASRKAPAAYSAERKG